ncbi:conserved Plasmodium protein, unknown function [Plasmodium ovale wallikeri]|uniref:Uncharacterized protein n=1 Tax=Plasmodium ovale wallikeri TaxID=864142 RepID=A0A1A8YQN0_PLAOA|nr:conserved Plasmodium protein, unknown function [Plasmodium ovale wallikeri]
MFTPPFWAYMIKSHDINTSSYDTSNEYSDLCIGNIFSEIQDEIKNACVVEDLRSEQSTECDNETLSREGSTVSGSIRGSVSGSIRGSVSGSIRGSVSGSIRGSVSGSVRSAVASADKNAATGRKINIEAYVHFISAKKNEYKKKKKEYAIEYINRRRLKKFHYEDMEFLFKKYSQFLDFQERCLLCNNYLSFSHLYLKKFMEEKKKKKKKKKDQQSLRKNLCVEENGNTTLLIFCECLEKMEYSEHYVSDRKDRCFIDMIHLFKKNSPLSLNIKKNIIIKEFIKNVKFTELYKYNSFNENCYDILPIKKSDNVDVKYINTCRYNEKPQLTIEHVKMLNSHTEKFTPLFKIHSANTLLTTVEKKLLIECLKYFLQKSAPSVRGIKMLATKIYRNNDEHGNKGEDMDF